MLLILAVFFDTDLLLEALEDSISDSLMILLVSFLLEQSPFFLLRDLLSFCCMFDAFIFMLIFFSQVQLSSYSLMSLFFLAGFSFRVVELSFSFAFRGSKRRDSLSCSISASCQGEERSVLKWCSQEEMTCFMKSRSQLKLQVRKSIESRWQMLAFMNSYDFTLCSKSLYSCSAISLYSVEIVKYPIEKCSICRTILRVFRKVSQYLSSSARYSTGTMSITQLIEQLLTCFSRQKLIFLTTLELFHFLIQYLALITQLLSSPVLISSRKTLMLEMRMRRSWSQDYLLFQSQAVILAWSSCRSVKRVEHSWVTCLPASRAASLRLACEFMVQNFKQYCASSIFFSMVKEMKGSMWLLRRSTPELEGEDCMESRWDLRLKMSPSRYLAAAVRSPSLQQQQAQL